MINLDDLCNVSNEMEQQLDHTPPVLSHGWQDDEAFFRATSCNTSEIDLASWLVDAVASCMQGCVGQHIVVKELKPWPMLHHSDI